MSKHSPAPWRVSIPSEFEMDEGVCIIGPNGPICEMSDGCDEDGSHPDAHLIASAPQMLDALLEVVRCCDSESATADETLVAYMRARDAIAKATVPA